MALVKDVIIGNDYDLQIVDGDFVVKPSDQQHVQLIIITAQGEWKEFPLLGVSVELYINAPASLQQLGKNIRLQLQSDNYTIRKLNVFGPTKIFVDGIRNN